MCMRMLNCIGSFERSAHPRNRLVRLPDNHDTHPKRTSLTLPRPDRLSGQQLCRSQGWPEHLDSSLEGVPGLVDASHERQDHALAANPVYQRGRSPRASAALSRPVIASSAWGTRRGRRSQSPPRTSPEDIPAALRALAQLASAGERREGPGRGGPLRRDQGGSEKQLQFKLGLILGIAAGSRPVNSMPRLRCAIASKLAERKAAFLPASNQYSMALSINPASVRWCARVSG